MQLKEIDALEQRIAELVIDDSIPIEQAIGQVCRETERRGVDAVLFAAISVAIHLDGFTGYTKENTVAASLQRHRVISAFAADVAAISETSRCCGDLLAFWGQTGDTLFTPTAQD